MRLSGPAYPGCEERGVPIVGLKTPGVDKPSVLL